MLRTALSSGAAGVARRISSSRRLSGGLRAAVGAVGSGTL